MKTACAKAVQLETLPEAAADRSRPLANEAERCDPAAVYWHPWDGSASPVEANPKGQWGQLAHRLSPHQVRSCQ
jgi:hypothetical protein